MGLGDAAIKYYPSHKAMIDDESLELDAVSVVHITASMRSARFMRWNTASMYCSKNQCALQQKRLLQFAGRKRKAVRFFPSASQPRFDENMKMLKRIVESGVLGRIYYIQTGGGRRRGIPTPFGTTFIEKDTGGIGALGDIGCYSLDMVLNAIGYPKPLTVSGYKSDFFGKRPETYPGHPEYADKFGVDDFAAAFVRLEGDVVLDFRDRLGDESRYPGRYDFDGYRRRTSHPFYRMLERLDWWTNDDLSRSGGRTG